MKVVRTITYEGDEKRVKEVLQHSLADGKHFFYQVTIHVETTEGNLQGGVEFRPKVDDEI
jgi:hypothetical protein